LPIGEQLGKRKCCFDCKRNHTEEIGVWDEQTRRAQ
jgi:hypothetical protein